MWSISCVLTNNRCFVADVYYLDPVTRDPEEDAVEFAERVKVDIYRRFSNHSDVCFSSWSATRRRLFLFHGTGTLSIFEFPISTFKRDKRSLPNSCCRNWYETNHNEILVWMCSKYIYVLFHWSIFRCFWQVFRIVDPTVHHQQHQKWRSNGVWRTAITDCIIFLFLVAFIWNSNVHVLLSIYLSIYLVCLCYLINIVESACNV